MTKFDFMKSLERHLEDTVDFWGKEDSRNCAVDNEAEYRQQRLGLIKNYLRNEIPMEEFRTSLFELDERYRK